MYLSNVVKYATMKKINERGKRSEKNSGYINDMFDDFICYRLQQ